MSFDQVLQIVLRVLHIGSGVFWVGAAWFFFGFIEPTTKAIGPQAGPFIHHLVRQRRITTVIVYAGAVNVVVGLLLYWRASGGLNSAWIGSPSGIGFTLGGLAAIVAFGLGMRQIAPTVNQLDEAGTAMASAGRPPTPDELAKFHALELRLHRAGLIDTVLLAIAIIFMAASRYLT